MARWRGIASLAGIAGDALILVALILQISALSTVVSLQATAQEAASQVDFREIERRLDQINTASRITELYARRDAICDADSDRQDCQANFDQQILEYLRSIPIGLDSALNKELNLIDRLRSNTADIRAEVKYVLGTLTTLHIGLFILGAVISVFSKITLHITGQNKRRTGHLWS